MSKLKRRVDKKQNKLKHMLLRDENIMISLEPTQHLVIGNGGLLNGVSRENLENLFSPYGDILDIVMQEKKSYSFVTFSSIEGAHQAFEALHGKLTKITADSTQSELKFYLAFIDRLPGYQVPSSNLPEGLSLVLDFVTEAEEESLLQCIDWTFTDHKLTQGSRQSLKHRHVKHYGYEFIYGINNVDRDKPLSQGIPEQCQSVIERMRVEGHVKHMPDQLTVNQYEPGQGIPPHVDTHSAFEDEIVSLSLGSQVVMEFRHPDGRHSSVLLPRRSLLVMREEARYVWTHGITPRKHDIIDVNYNSQKYDQSKTPATPEAESDITTAEAQSEQSATSDVSGQTGNNRSLTLLHRDTRTSFTFRKILHKPCSCKYPEQCDSQKDKAVETTETPSLPTTDSQAQKLEALHVHKVYEEIAAHFSDTRHTPWPRIVDFLKRQAAGSVVLDVGCGNGKYLSANTNCFQLGCDRSAALCGICKERGHSVFVSDCLMLPVRDAALDVCISIAVIHHLATPDRRQAAVQEMVRVLRMGGQALIYVWAKDQKRERKGANPYLKKDKQEADSQKIEAENELVKRLSEKDLSDKATNAAGEISSEMNDMEISSASNSEKDTNRNKDKPPCDNTLIESESSEKAKEKQTEASGQLKVHVNRTDFQSQDLLVPWHLRQAGANKTSKSDEKEGQVYHRYYHVFEEGELEELCEKVPRVKVIESYYDKGNWCVILEKVP